MNNARNVTQNCQENVDEEIGIATSLEKDTEGREDDGKDDFADVAIRDNVSNVSYNDGLFNCMPRSLRT